MAHWSSSSSPQLRMLSTSPHAMAAHLGGFNSGSSRSSFGTHRQTTTSERGGDPLLLLTFSEIAKGPCYAKTSGGRARRIRPLICRRTVSRPWLDLVLVPDLSQRWWIDTCLVSAPGVPRPRTCTHTTLESARDPPSLGHSLGGYFSQKLEICGAHVSMCRRSGDRSRPGQDVSPTWSTWTSALRVTWTEVRAGRRRAPSVMWTHTAMLMQR